MKINDYFKSVVEETKAIVFPPRKRVVSDSTIVISSLVVSGVFIGAIDFVFSKGVQQLIAIIQK